MVMKKSFFRPSRSVSQPKNERADHGADEIGAAGEADLGIREAQGGAGFQRAGDRPRKRHLQPVEDPGDPERRDDENVEPAPGQTLEARGDQRRDNQAAHVARGRTGDIEGRRRGHHVKQQASCKGWPKAG